MLFKGALDNSRNDVLKKGACRRLLINLTKRIEGGFNLRFGTGLQGFLQEFLKLFFGMARGRFTVWHRSTPEGPLSKQDLPAHLPAPLVRSATAVSVHG